MHFTAPSPHTSTHAKQRMFRHAITLWDNLIQVDGKYHIDNSTDIQGDETSLCFRVHCTQWLITRGVSTVKSHVVEHADVGETRQEVGKPVHLVRDVPYCQVHGDCYGARPNW